jgi:hypothetical protein
VLDGSAVLHKTERQSKAAYINTNQRVSQVSGKAVKAALLELVTNRAREHFSMREKAKKQLLLGIFCFKIAKNLRRKPT